MEYLKEKWTDLLPFARALTAMHSDCDSAARIAPEDQLQEMLGDDTGPMKRASRQRIA